MQSNINLALVPTHRVSLISDETAITKFPWHRAARDSKVLSDLYADARKFSSEMDEASLQSIAFARLHALNEHGIEQLAGKLSRADFISIFRAVKGEVFSAESIDDLVEIVSDCELYDLDPKREIPLSSLVASFSRLEHFALVDVLERCYYCKLEGEAYVDSAQRLGLVFAD